MRTQYWRIGTSLNTLTEFDVLKIPIPTDWEYRRFSIEKNQSTGGSSLHGYLNLSLQWQSMPLHIFDLLINYFNGGTVYMTFTEGVDPSWSFVDGHGVPKYPVYQVRSGEGVVDITWVINNVTIDNRPSNLFDAVEFWSHQFDQAKNSFYQP